MTDIAFDSPARGAAHAGSAASHPDLVVYVLALGVFLMGTTEFLVAALLPAIASGVGISTTQAGLTITVFAIGMIVGAPATAVATLRVPQWLTLSSSLVVFALGHVAAALAPNLLILLGARFVTALATGAFWAVAAVVASTVAGAESASSAVGIVNAGGMLATVIGVPAGAVLGAAMGWRGSFWALAVLALLGLVPILRFVPRTPAAHGSVSVGKELTALRSGRLWLALAGCAGATGGTLAAYSYIVPILTDRTGLSASAVPLVLAGFGIGSLIGSVVGGRLGDSHPSVTIVVAPVVTIGVLAGLALLADAALPTMVLVCLLGLFGLGANPVLISLAVKYASHAPTLGSSLSVASFNTGTAVASWLGGVALDSALRTNGPIVVGIVISLIALVPVTVLALRGRRETARGPVTGEG